VRTTTGQNDKTRRKKNEIEKTETGRNNFNGWNTKLRGAGADTELPRLSSWTSQKNLLLVNNVNMDIDGSGSIGKPIISVLL
jgi:hypothetical protein